MPKHKDAWSNDYAPNMDWDPYWDDYDLGSDDWEHDLHLALCERVKNGTEKVTPELLQSVTDPDWKRELIEAICLGQINQKRK